MTDLAHFSPIQLAALRAYQQMTASSQKVAKEFDSIEIELANLDILTRYDMGVKLIEIGNEPTIYGPNAVEQLAVVTGHSASDLSAMQTFASQFPRSVVEDAARRLTSDRRHITFDHFRLLSSVQSETERYERLEQMFTNPISIRELQRQLKALDKGKAKRSRDGKKQAKAPSSPLHTDVELTATTPKADLSSRLPDGGADECELETSDELSGEEAERLLQKLLDSLDQFGDLPEPMARLRDESRMAFNEYLDNSHANAAADADGVSDTLQAGVGAGDSKSEELNVDDFDAGDVPERHDGDYEDDEGPDTEPPDFDEDDYVDDGLIYWPDGSIG